jgi:hypothetical protein
LDLHKYEFYYSTWRFPLQCSFPDRGSEGRVNHKERKEHKGSVATFAWQCLKVFAARIKFYGRRSLYELYVAVLQMHSAIHRGGAEYVQKIEPKRYFNPVPTIKVRKSEKTSPEKVVKPMRSKCHHW